MAIAFFGTSHTYGDCSEGILNKTWPQLFSLNLNKECYNYGISGSDNITIIDAILEAFDRGLMEEVDTVILEPRLDFDSVKLPFDHIDYAPNKDFKHTGHGLDNSRYMQEHTASKPVLTEKYWVSFALEDLKSKSQFKQKLNAKYNGTSQLQQDKDITKFVELTKLYHSQTNYMRYINYQFIKNVYHICKGYGIKFYWINWESDEFENFSIFFENDKYLLDLCLNKKENVRTYFDRMFGKEKTIQEYLCSCKHFNQNAQSVITSYLIDGYNKRNNK